MVLVSLLGRLRSVASGSRSTRGGRSLLLVGLDCADPELVFRRWRGELPTLSRLMASGIYGPLRSCIPPITVPAWMCMMTGKDPGELGIYGFRNRIDHSYDRYQVASSASIDAPTVWDRLGEVDRESVVIGFPPTYPVRPMRGHLVSCFLTPDTATSQFTHPLPLADEIEDLVGEYAVDAKGFRTEERDELLERIYDMTEKRFKVARHLMTTKPWDLFMMMEIGVDRMHHAFWHYMDELHVLYPGPSEYENAILDYYRRVDTLLGSLIDDVGDETRIVVVSDHGATRMDGGIAVNEWLIQNGYLVLREQPESATRPEDLDVDWSRTRAWAAGGYYARVFFNVKGREPQGLLQQAEVASFRSQLKAELEALGDAEGNPIGTRVVLPEDMYATVRGVAPDMMVFFGDLKWRAVATVGTGRIHWRENDTGPDGANHDWDGIFIMSDGRSFRTRSEGRGEIGTVDILDIAPTLAGVLGLDDSGYSGTPVSYETT